MRCVMPEGSQATIRCTSGENPTWIHDERPNIRHIIIVNVSSSDTISDGTQRYTHNTLYEQSDSVCAIMGVYVVCDQNNSVRGQRDTSIHWV